MFFYDHIWRQRISSAASFIQLSEQKKCQKRCKCNDSRRALCINVNTFLRLRFFNLWILGIIAIPWRVETNCGNNVCDSNYRHRRACTGVHRPTSTATNRTLTCVSVVSVQFLSLLSITDAHFGHTKKKFNNVWSDSTCDLSCLIARFFWHVTFFLSHNYPPVKLQRSNYIVVGTFILDFPTRFIFQVISTSLKWRQAKWNKNFTLLIWIHIFCFNLLFFIKRFKNIC